VAETAGSVPSEMNRQATAAAGTARSALDPRGGGARGVVRSAAPAAHDAEAVGLQGRVVESACRANQAARGVGAASPPRFCLIGGTPPLTRAHQVRTQRRNRRPLTPNTLPSFRSAAV
jgi:hypothetical protein